MSAQQCMLYPANYIHHLQSEGCLFHDADVGMKTSATFKSKCQAPDFSPELFVINHKILQGGKRALPQGNLCICRCVHINSSLGNFQIKSGCSCYRGIYDANALKKPLKDDMRTRLDSAPLSDRMSATKVERCCINKLIEEEAHHWWPRRHRNGVIFHPWYLHHIQFCLTNWGWNPGLHL